MWPPCPKQATRPTSRKLNNTGSELISADRDRVPVSVSFVFRSVLSRSGRLPNAAEVSKSACGERAESSNSQGYGAGSSASHGLHCCPAARTPQNLKWAASQEAVTLPWLSAHSIRTRIGGDTYIVDPPAGLSRINFQPPTSSIVSICEFRAKRSAIIDTFLAIVLALSVFKRLFF